MLVAVTDTITTDYPGDTGAAASSRLRPARAIPAQPYPPHTPGLPWLPWLPRAGLRRLLAAAPVVTGVVGGDGVRVTATSYQHALLRNRMVTGCAQHSPYPVLSLLDQKWGVFIDW